MIFILGGGGFVGSAFARFCETVGWDHSVITRHNYASHMSQPCDIFVNANGNSRKNLALRAPLEDFDASVRTVRKTLVDFACNTYVLLSSCDVYPDCSAPQLTVESSEIDVARQSPYGFHKYVAELAVRHAAKKWLIVRLGGFVGAGLWKNPIYDILTGGPLWLDPESELQFLSTDVAAQIVMGLARGVAENEIVNVCGKGTIRLTEVIDAMPSPVVLQTGSPRVTYDVSIAKLEQFVRVPETRSTVLEFVRAQRGQSGPAHSA